MLATGAPVTVKVPGAGVGWGLGDGLTLAVRAGVALRGDVPVGLAAPPPQAARPAARVSSRRTQARQPSDRRGTGAGNSADNLWTSDIFGCIR
jgi:hypothetical protein